MEILSEQSLDSNLQSLQDSTKVKIPPCYSLYGYIYQGIDIDENDMIDLRIRFAIPYNIDVKKFRVTYMVFPFGASDSEFTSKEL